ncbi:hypothetical protein KOW79_016357 [Hemibagrus wyckioides]|uniref:Uncharacterized protein n=1 Tax=Hemibagrus wyckioides TaxID=337641 RepID=A0A9D3NF92_9TELE|nr:hypothetical protein KOW79_016357 [Hemibagrus wyckioides]
MRTGARVAPWRPASGARIPSADVTGAPWLASLLVVVVAAVVRVFLAFNGFVTHNGPSGRQESRLNFSSDRLNWISETVTVLFNPE